MSQNDVQLACMFFRRHLTSELSVVAILCTLAIFFFLAPAGPYSVVHGPVTVFRALRSSVSLFWSMVVAAFSRVALFPLARATSGCSSAGWKRSAFGGWNANLVLRC